MQVRVAITKSKRRPPVPLLGLGVTARCNETGLVATEIDAMGGGATPISSGLARRRQRIGRSRQRDREIIEAAGMTRVSQGDLQPAFPFENDDLGRTKGEQSWIGVVHVDGNGIGQKIGRWLRRCVDEGVSDERVIEEYRALSKALNDSNCQNHSHLDRY